MITKQQAQKYLEEALSQGGSFAEIFIERNASTTCSVNTNEVEDINTGVTLGLGVRIYVDTQSVYAYTNDLGEESILKMIQNLANSIDKAKMNGIKKLEEITFETRHPILQPVEEVSIDRKVDVMLRASRAALAYDECIQKTIVRYLDEHRTIWIFNSKGKMISDDQTRVRLLVSAVAIDGDIMQDGYYAPGAHQGFEFFEQNDVEEFAHKAASSAVAMLHAKDCPSGEMTVVIDNGFGGVIFHEACGHSLEATSVAKGNSVFCNKIGQQIANTVVSAMDDGTIPNAWGSNNIDDEGNFTQANLLIESGILKSYLVDQFNGMTMECESNGSGRRQSYAFEPTSRMSNTFILNGDSTFDEIIAATQKGIYAKRLGGGSVSPASGDFNFACSEAYLIENGKITTPVKGATLVGNGAQILLDIDMVANNGSRDQGMCGSSSGTIPADVGQPTIRVSKMTVGGKGGSFND